MKGLKSIAIVQGRRALQLQRLRVGGHGFSSSSHRGGFARLGSRGVAALSLSAVAATGAAFAFADAGNSKRDEVDVEKTVRHLVDVAAKGVEKMKTSPTVDAFRPRFEDMILNAQDSICRGLADMEGPGAAFEEDVWYRSQGGGGRSRVLTGNNVFEKAGCNISIVQGNLPRWRQSK